MKKMMSIAAIALFVAGSAAFACDTCGCQAKKAEGKKTECTAKKDCCGKKECASKKECSAKKECDSKKEAAAKKTEAE